MNKTRKNTVALTVLVLVISFLARANDVDHPTGIYSNLRYDRDSGDLSGMEIFIINSNKGYFATYQCAAGEAAKPVLLPVNIHGKSIELVVPDSFKYFCDIGRFTGVINEKGIRGKFEITNKEVFLKRSKSYWQ